MGEEIYKPLIEDMTWSYSRVSSFDDCPYKWFMRYIGGEKETPMFYSSYGKFMHELLAEHYSDGVSPETLKMKFLFGFRDRVRGDRPSDRIVTNYVESGVRYFESFEPLPYEPIATEKFVVFTVGDHPFIGYIDLLAREGDTLVVADHKSRKLSPRSKRKKPTAKDAELDEMLRQLYLYAEAVKQELGVFPTKLVFNCFREGKVVEEPFDPDAHKRTLDWALETIERIENAESFPPHPDFFRCRNLCGLHDECVYFAEGTT